MLNKLKKNRKKGFTLVELIVVLVILAILAALLIPALTGYIDKAKERQILAETRQAVMAAQTIADEEYATATPDASIKTNLEADTGKIIVELADIPTPTSITVTVTGGKITNLVYVRDNWTCTYKGAGSYDGPSKVTPAGP